MQTFDENSKVYDAFKKFILESLKKSLDELMQSDEFSKTFKDRSKNFRKKWLEIVNEEINEGYQQFKNKLGGNICELIESNNPYSNFEGGKMIVFPKDTKFWMRDQNKITLLIEQEPLCRTVRTNKEEWEKNAYLLSFPFCIFIITFTVDDGSENWKADSIKFGFSPTPLESLSDTIYEAPLSDLKVLDVCMGPNWDIPVNGSIGNKTRRMLDYFWNSSFRFEWISNIDRCKDNRVKSFDAWEEATKKDPFFIHSVDLIPAGTVKEILGNLMMDNGSVFSQKFAQKTVENAVASSWESVKKNRSDELKELESSFCSSVETSSSFITNKLYEKIVAEFDKTLTKHIPSLKDNPLI